MAGDRTASTSARGAPMPAVVTAIVPAPAAHGHSDCPEGGSVALPAMGRARSPSSAGSSDARLSAREREVLAFALCIGYGFAFEWIFVLAGMAAANAQAAQGISFLVFPLTFVSSAYVPVATMPGWLQVFAAHQPITYMVDAVRVLTLGPAGHVLYPHPASYYVTRSLLWSAAIIAVTAPLAIARYRKG